MDARLYNAAKSGNIQLLQRLANEDPDLLLQLTPKKNTALHIAARYGHKEFVINMCCRCRSLVTRANEEGNTPLHVVARAGYFNVADFLLDWVRRFDHDAENGRINLHELMKMRNGENDTALDEAVRNGHERLAILLMRADPELVQGDTLFLATEHGCLKVVEHILGELREVPVDLIRERRTTMVAAVVYGHFDIFKRLADREPQLLKLADASGIFPLHYASYLGRINFVQELLRLDTSTAYLLDKNGQAPIHMASKNGRANVIELLLQSCPDSIELIDKRRQNALHVAIAKKKGNVVSFILRTAEFEELINEKDSDGNTPLHIATINNCTSIVKMLLADGRVDVRALNKDSQTALDIALCNSETSIQPQKFLIRKALILSGATETQWERSMKDDVEQACERSINSLQTMVNAILMMSIFIASLSFAAPFTLPGGDKTNGSKHNSTFFSNVFMFTDMATLFLSIIVTQMASRAAIVGGQYLTITRICLFLNLLDLALVMLAIAFLAGALSMSRWRFDIVILFVEILYSICSIFIFIPIATRWRRVMTTTFRKNKLR